MGRGGGRGSKGLAGPPRSEAARGSGHYRTVASKSTVALSVSIFAITCEKKAKDWGGREIGDFSCSRV